MASVPTGSSQENINIQNDNQTPPPQFHPHTTNNPSHNHNNNSNNHNHNHSNNNNNGSIINPNKRSLDQLHPFENSPYFKIRAIVNELRPLVLQASTAPDFDTSEARHGILEKLELMVDQCKKQTTSLINGNGSEKQANKKPLVLSLPRAYQSSQEKLLPSGNTTVKQTNETHGIPGSYIVGGSAFGWNFLMFHGTKPIYYGRTKEAFRAEE